MADTLNSDVLLSICIPTYNRPKEFERMITGLLGQISSDNVNDIEFFVRDDSDNLDTKLIFENCIKSLNVKFNYIKGHKIGLDAANLFSIEKASGKYIWWVSDDDEIQPNAISHILGILKRDPEITYIWINFAYESIDRISVCRDEGYFSDKNDVLASLGVNFGLVTTHLFKRSIAFESLSRAQKHVVGFSFAGLVPILHVLSQPGKFYFLSGPYILCHPTTNEEVVRIVNSSGQIKNEAFNVYGVNFYNIINEFKSDFSKKAVKKILALNFASLWRGMLVGWIGGWDTPAGKRWRMFKLYWSFPEFWIALPAFLIPLWFNKLIYKFYKLFFHERKFIFFSKKKNSVRQGTL